jgi:hypothetical protein
MTAGTKSIGFGRLVEIHSLSSTQVPDREDVFGKVREFGPGRVGIFPARGREVGKGWEPASADSIPRDARLIEFFLGGSDPASKGKAARSRRISPLLLRAD